MNHRSVAPAAFEHSGGSGATHASPALRGDRSPGCKERQWGGLHGIWLLLGKWE